jgi:hypothetical protein
MFLKTVLMIIGVIAIALGVAYVANGTFGIGLVLFGAGLLLTGTGAPAGLSTATIKVWGPAGIIILFLGLAIYLGLRI